MVARWAVTVVSPVVVSAHMSDEQGNTYQSVQIYNAEVVDHVALSVRLGVLWACDVGRRRRWWVLCNLCNGGGVRVA